MADLFSTVRGWATGASSPSSSRRDGPTGQINSNNYEARLDDAVRELRERVKLQEAALDKV
jgi:hypothetical protein